MRRREGGGNRKDEATSWPEMDCSGPFRKVLVVSGAGSFLAGQGADRDGEGALRQKHC